MAQVHGMNTNGHRDKQAGWVELRDEVWLKPLNLGMVSAGESLWPWDEKVADRRWVGRDGG